MTPLTPEQAAPASGDIQHSPAIAIDPADPLRAVVTADTDAAGMDLQADVDADVTLEEPAEETRHAGRGLRTLRGDSLAHGQWKYTAMPGCRSWRMASRSGASARTLPGRT